MKPTLYMSPQAEADRQARLDAVNRFIAEPCPLKRATPFLICAAAVISVFCYFIGFI